MGIFGVQDAFSSKYHTLQVFGPNGSWDISVLKQQTGSLCFIKIPGRGMMCFELDFSRLKTYRKKGAKIIQTLLYSTEDTIPIDSEGLSKLETYLAENKIQKLDVEGAELIIMAAKKMKDMPDGSTLTVRELLGDTIDVGRIEAAAEKIINTTGITQLVKPTPEISDLLSSRMMVNPTAYTNLVGSVIRWLNPEWNKIANPAKGPFKHWFLICVLVGMGAVMGGVAFIGAEQGWFDGAGFDFGFGGFGGDGEVPWDRLQSMFPDGPPEQLDLRELEPDDLTTLPVEPVEPVEPLIIEPEELAVTPVI